MNNQITFRRIVALSAILSVPVTLASTVVLLMAVDFNAEFMSDPTGLITIGAPASDIFRWGSILELGAPTLLFVPVVLYLWYWLKPRASELVTLYTVFGMASLLLAAIGSLLRASLYPPLIDAYAQAAQTQRDVLMAIFQGITAFNFEGLWALELICWGIWWLGIGPLLRSERRILGIVTMILGIVYLVAGAGWLLRVGPLARLENAFFFVPFWAVWFSITILRGTETTPR